MGWNLEDEYYDKIPVYKFRFGREVQTHIKVVGLDGKIIRISFDLNDKEGISNQKIEVLKEERKKRLVEKDQITGKEI
ncbi:hypothetical protein KAW18_03040 [candidate division WOR-3 bacterium]|nr:hypothetical protein [candidate division WOR-3 bacterium]